jgi:hypothetical protein
MGSRYEAFCLLGRVGRYHIRETREEIMDSDTTVGAAIVLVYAVFFFFHSFGFFKELGEVDGGQS